MLKKIDLSKEKNKCKTTNELICSSNFHTVVDAFCRRVAADGNELTHLINKCFKKSGAGQDDQDNDVDVWKISRIILDAYNNRFVDYKSTFENNELKTYFKRFLGALYNYYMTEYEPYLIDEDVFDHEIETNMQIKNAHKLLSLVMNSYSTIIVNIEKFEFVQRINY